jgi:hypothetical protein
LEGDITFSQPRPLLNRETFSLPNIAIFYTSMNISDFQEIKAGGHRTKNMPFLPWGAFNIPEN